MAGRGMMVQRRHEDGSDDSAMGRRPAFDSRLQEEREPQGHGRVGPAGAEGQGVFRLRSPAEKTGSLGLIPPWPVPKPLLRSAAAVGECADSGWVFISINPVWRAGVTTFEGSTLGVHVRWMIRRDMPEVVTIEQEAFEFPWSEADFTRCLRQRNCIGMVAEMADSVVAFMIYELHRTKLHMLNFAVLRSHRRLGIGSRMMERLLAKLTPDRRGRIMLEVRETNLPAQLFFRSLSFRATSVLKDFYQDSTEDAYMMQFSLDQLPAEHRLAG